MFQFNPELYNKRLRYQQRIVIVSCKIWIYARPQTGKLTILCPIISPLISCGISVHLWYSFSATIGRNYCWLETLLVLTLVFDHAMLWCVRLSIWTTDHHIKINIDCRQTISPSGFVPRHYFVARALWRTIGTNQYCLVIGRHSVNFTVLTPC